MELQLSDAVLERLIERADALGLRPEALASAAVTDFVARKDQALEEAVRKVLEENADLSQRLV